MANTVTTRVVLDGPRLACIHVWLASDGAAGELTDQVVVDVSTLTPAPTKVSVMSVEGHLVGFTGRLEFDATADIPFASLPQDEYFCVDFTKFAGLKDNSGAGSTGDIVLTTAGFTAVTDIGHLVIWVKKD